MIPATSSIREYAAVKTGALLEEAVAAIQHAAGKPDEPAVHKMRVAIRRLQQAVRLFQQYLKPAGVTFVKAELRSIMQVAGEVRNRDIGIELVQKAASGHAAHLTRQRHEYKRRLDEILQQHTGTDLVQAWRDKLGLGGV